MLEQLLLRNFQKHEKLVIDLDEYVTVLVGRSDAGKSACLRALRWLAINRPLGDSFVRHGAGYVRVEAKIDGHHIKREKVGGENAYILDGEKYHAFGGGIPDSIANLLNLSDDINFQGQHSSPFWLSLSPGEVSRQLNAIIDLGLIDNTLSNLSSEVKRAKAAVQVSEERLTQARQRKNNLKWVVEADQQLKEIETLATQINNNSGQAQRLESVLGELNRSKQVVARGTKQILQAEAVVAVGDKMQKVRDQHVKLCTLISDLESVHAKIDVLVERVKDMEQELVEATKGQCPICGGELK